MVMCGWVAGFTEVARIGRFTKGWLGVRCCCDVSPLLGRLMLCYQTDNAARCHHSLGYVLDELQQSVAAMTSLLVAASLAATWSRHLCGNI